MTAPETPGRDMEVPEVEIANLRGEILCLCVNKNGYVILNALAQIIAAIANAGPEGNDLPAEIAAAAESYRATMVIPALSIGRRQ